MTEADHSVAATLAAGSNFAPGSTFAPVADATAAPDARRFDPASPVPEEYDVFCEGCGYSLVGLAAERCPECGRPYDPLALPYARVPWLHRRRIGRWPGFWQTVRRVTFRPAEFAAEVCRPVRISRDDARRFRGAATLVAATALVAAVMGAIYFTTGPWSRGDRLAFWIVLPVAWAAAVLFLRLATDMPVFIWGGLPSRPAHELAPLHHYAAAPLAYAPPVAALAAAPALAELYDAPLWVALVLVVAGAMVLVGWLIVCWHTPVALMRAATGCGRKRMALLALYLPLHALVMFLVAVLTFMLCMIPVSELVEYLERRF